MAVVVALLPILPLEGEFASKRIICVVSFVGERVGVSVVGAVGVPVVGTGFLVGSRVGLTVGAFVGRDVNGIQRQSLAFDPPHPPAPVSIQVAPAVFGFPAVAVNELEPLVHSTHLLADVYPDQKTPEHNTPAVHNEFVRLGDPLNAVDHTPISVPSTELIVDDGVNVYFVGKFCSVSPVYDMNMGVR